jgi:pullulanase
MIVDLKSTNPSNWETDTRPPMADLADAIIYEAHVRDLTISPSSGVETKGKFLGLAQTNTRSPQDEKTGLDHIKELGITHLHLLPIYNFMSVDETAADGTQYNWGYDPQHYNALEGWYATDPHKGNTSIREFKQLVHTLHKAGIRVVMDVVYNHTGYTRESVFEQSAPGYFYRFAPNGTFSNASGCGNEIASERPMVRQYIIDSIRYWAKEYHLDGFRFDLMGILDIETMNQIRAELDTIDPTILIYGEGWTGGLSPYPDNLRAMKYNTMELQRIGSFSDDYRDAIKGHWSSEYERGFASGQMGYEESIKFGVVGATIHPQINYNWVNYSKQPWSPCPSQTVNYVSCHDNHTLWDKLSLSVPEASIDDRLKMQKLALAMVLTSQGLPLLHSGVEMARTKHNSHNSYNQPDAINQIDWLQKSRYKGLFNYVKSLISLRKSHPAFRMRSTEAVAKHLEFLPSQWALLVGFLIKNHANNDPWDKILVIYNGSKQEQAIQIPEGEWVIVANRNTVDNRGIDLIAGPNLKIQAISTLILVDKESFYDTM